eukprot:scaffold94350_cov62-Phaeocystis_antarctica.AAC.2
MTRLLLLLLPALAQPFRRKMVEESSPACPGSPSPRHAKCSLRVEFEQPCAEVQAEVAARLRGGQGWRCPKTHPGTYTLLSASAGAVRGSRETGPGSTPPGPGKSYTDSFGFTFAERALGGGCMVHACSESQGPSGCDFSTNYCNLRNLPIWPASAAQAADWPRLAEAQGSLRHGLSLKGASGEPAGRGLSRLVFHIGAAPRADRQGAVWRLLLPRAEMQGQPQGRAGDQHRDVPTVTRVTRGAQCSCQELCQELLCQELCMLHVPLRAAK